MRGVAKNKWNWLSDKETCGLWASEKHLEHSGAYFNICTALKRQHGIRDKKPELGVRTCTPKCQT